MNILQTFLPSYLTFSDGAKFALIAKSIYLGHGYTTNFSFWGDNLFATGGIPYLLPNIIYLFYKLFGVNDFAVVMFSFTFYLLLIFSVYLLGTKLFDKTVGFLSALIIAFNMNFIDYATSGASETLFAFEIVIAMYFLSFKKLWVNAIGFVVLGAMYFSRPQAFIFMAGLFLYWLIVKLGIKKALLTFSLFGVIGFLFDKFIIYPLSFKYPLTPIFARGIQSILSYSSSAAISDGLRGAASSTLTVADIVKKVFYNLYNFYKLLPEIGNPYIWGLFFISIFVIGKNKIQSSFKYASLFMIGVTFLITALTIPFYRYLHPVMPLVTILAVSTLVEFVNVKFSKKVAILISTCLVLLMSVGQTVGALSLDVRFKNRLVNISKPPIYVLMANELRNNTSESGVVLTNLDTWGSWYGDRKTVWFPLEPYMVLNSKNNFDYIYLTSYKMEDDNYKMSDTWKKIFNDPKNQTILGEYVFKSEIQFNASENYERQDGRAVLLVKKKLK